MKPSDFFGYQISDNGRLVLPGLTPEETLEYELLSRQKPDQHDGSSQMRELELFLKQHRARAGEPAVAKGKLELIPRPVHATLRTRLGNSAAASRRVDRLDTRSVVAIMSACLGAGILTIFLIANL